MSTYIYAITSAAHPLRLDNVVGVGQPPSELRVIGTDALSAVVSDAPADLRAKRRDLVAHQTVLENLLADGAALPMRFGLLGPDDDQVIAALERQQDDYSVRLKELEGCLEYNLKVARDEQDLLREIVNESGEVRELRERTRQNPGAHDEMVALGELISHEVQAREQQGREEITSRLEHAAVRVVNGEPTKTHFLNVSFLVERDRAATFTQAVHEEAERWGDAFTHSLNGPLPPYSFV
ncbi:GvpL/GvpF family gas vesicle protein [Streptomyces sp. NBC_01197]|uniref:GvpL/GvpF family gas vesicle protein n=1 Tax=Streptomyces sp. NBC_01197 TaxID=2903768 RepID=UPI002E0E8E85|nr:GvpL/GvpF family gas vesicle protein [Streptomyces sp. NBC_01197]